MLRSWVLGNLNFWEGLYLYFIVGIHQNVFVIHMLLFGSQNNHTVVDKALSNFAFENEKYMHFMTYLNSDF